MSQHPPEPAVSDVETMRFRVPPHIKNRLHEQAAERGMSLNAFMMPFFNAVARSDMRLSAEVKHEKLLPDRPCGGCKK